MRIPITALGESTETMSSEILHEVSANSSLMLKAGVTNGSMAFSLYGYVAGDADIWKVYETLGIDPYTESKCNRCNLLGDGCVLYHSIEHMNDYHRDSLMKWDPILKY